MTLAIEHNLKPQTNPKGKVVSWLCACGYIWTKKTTEKCPAITYYNWHEAPTRLKTESDLKAQKLKPGGPPSGALWYGKYDKWIWLYDESEAVARPKASAAQLAALEKARLKRRICPECKEDAGYILDGAICEACEAKAELMDREEDAREASQIAKSVLDHADKYVILDTETTGLGYGNRIIEIAVIGIDGAALLNERIKPPEPFEMEEEAYYIHHIHPDMLRDCPSFAEIYPKLCETVKGKIIISYGSSFDEGKVRYECEQHNLPKIPASEWQCAKELYAQYYGEWSKYHGSYRWQSLPDGDHSALGDCVAVLNLLKGMANRKPRTIEELIAFDV